MKIAVISDIHGNVFALERVMKEIHQRAIDWCIFCGDLCGYYYLQNEAIDFIRNRKNTICVMGNHDKLFLDSLKDEKILDDYSARYGGSLRYLKGNISCANLEFLRGLPLSYEDKAWNLAVFHGSPWDRLNEYIYPTDPVDRFKDFGRRFVLLGHTHYPMHQRIGDVQIVNPGSVGQPRDDHDASYAIVDLARGSVEFRRVEYDVRALTDDLKRRKEDKEYLFNILYRKKNG